MSVNIINYLDLTQKKKLPTNYNATFQDSSIYTLYMSF